MISKKRKYFDLFERLERGRKYFENVDSASAKLILFYPCVAPRDQKKHIGKMVRLQRRSLTRRLRGY